MERLQCVGNGRLSEVSSKVNEKEPAPMNPVCATPADPLAKESVEWKPKQQKQKPSGKIQDTVEIQDPSINSDTTHYTFKTQSSKRQQKPKPSGKTEKQDPSVNTTNTVTKQSSSRGYNAPKAPSFKNVTTHGHKLPKHVLHVMTEQQATSEVKLDSKQEPHILPVLSKSDPHPHVKQGEEEESEENDTDEDHVPFELFAEFLQAVMTKNYQLAKKLCQMILIYEPQNSEAKNFLPLIEEKLLIETEESSDNDDESDESDTSDDEEDVSNDDEDVDDNESSDSSDTDEESTDSTDDTLSPSS